MNQISDINNRHLASYLLLRRGIGILGFALPFILFFGGMLLHGPEIRRSISAYYHSGMGDVFVGTIFVIGVFLFAYKGYEPRDDRAGDFAFFCAAGLAFFSTFPEIGTPSRGLDLILSPATLDLAEPSRVACVALGSNLLESFPELLARCPDLEEPTGLEKVIAVVHGLFAAGLFLTLAYFSIFLFTKSDPNQALTPKKRQRNFVYRTNGYVMLLAIALIVLGFLIRYLGLLPDAIAAMVMSYKPIFWLESIIIVAFGISWLVKGEAILKDEI